MALPQEHLCDFIRKPWCRALLTSSDYIVVRTPSREVPQPDSIHAHTFFSGTLATETGLRAVISLEELATGDLIMLFSLGTGLNGPQGIIHGGLIMTLLDAATALLAHRATKSPVLTTRHEIQFQRKITGPCIVLARASTLHQQGNSIVTEAQLEDAVGNIYAKTTSTLLKERAAKL